MAFTPATDVMEQRRTDTDTSEQIVPSTYGTEITTTYIMDGEPVYGQNSIVYDEIDWASGGCYAARENGYCPKAYSGPIGRFALGNFNCGNPGGKKSRTKLNAVNKEMIYGKQHLWCLQEANKAVFQGLRNCKWIDGDINRRSSADYQAYMGNNPSDKPKDPALYLDGYSGHDGPCRHQILAVCHSEGGAQSGLMFCGRTTHVSCLRLMYYENYNDGPYKEGRETRNAFTEFAVASYYMKRWQIGEPSAVADDFAGQSLRIANCHLHHAVARKTNTVKAQSVRYRETFDRWAISLKKYVCRFFCGDFNMAAIEVIMQLRARGFCANIISWYPWRHLNEAGLAMDSVLILAIGPIEGIRLPFRSRAILPDSAESNHPKCKPMQWTCPTTKQTKDYELYTLDTSDVPGQQVTSYRPVSEKRKANCIRWMFRPELGTGDVTMDLRSWYEMTLKLEQNGKYMPGFAMRHNKLMDLCMESWNWPPLPSCKSKPVAPEYFDPLQTLIGHGAHVPLITWVGGNKDGSRSEAANKKRSDKRKNKENACQGWEGNAW